MWVGENLEESERRGKLGEEGFRRELQALQKAGIVYELHLRTCKCSFIPIL